MDLEILYEDNHLIAINKPNGILVHADNTRDNNLEEILREYVREKYQKPGNVFLQPCHRLDRPVSGALIFAKTSKGKERMRQLFTDRKVDKTYLAMVNRCPDPYEAELENWMYKDRDKNIVEIVKGNRPGAVRAKTRYRTLGQVGKHFLVQLHPISGKSHQLRVHMSMVGSPILGDVKYGGQNIQDPSTLLLHCREMQFIHPIQQIPLIISAKLPDHVWWNRYREEIEALEKSD